MERFFVKVYAQSKRALLGLHKYELDLFQSTARATEDNRFNIDGLLTMEQIERLVRDGYSVLVEHHESHRSRAAHEVADFQEWLEERRRGPMPGYLSSAGIGDFFPWVLASHPPPSPLFMLPPT